MTKHNDFNRVATVYDLLATIVFGRSLRKAQLCFFDEFPAAGKVLVIGGGTDWIAVELLKRYPQLKVTYVEASSKMLEISQQRLSNYPKQISFVHGTENSIPERETYDVVVTNFFLDLFPDAELRKVIKILKSRMQKNALWVVTDFQDQGKWWQRVMLQAMYAFFKITANIGANRLPNWNSILKEAGLIDRQSNTFFSGFIISKIVAISE